MKKQTFITVLLLILLTIGTVNATKITGSDELVFILSQESATVYQDFEEVHVSAIFKFTNGTTLNERANISATLVTGKFASCLRPPLSISRINTTHWDLYFKIQQRRGFAADTYVINITAQYINLKTTKNFTLEILANEDTLPPTILFTDIDGTQINSLYDLRNNKTASFNLYVKDNRMINYYSFWNYEKSTSVNTRGSAGECPINLTSNGQIVFTNMTDIIVINMTLTGHSFDSLGVLESDFTFSIFALDWAGNKNWLGENMTIALDNYPPTLGLDIPKNKFNPEQPITISWNYSEPNSKSPLEFKIEVDTDGDLIVDFVLEEKWAKTTYEFIMPTNWKIPNPLPEVDTIEKASPYEIRITATDLYGNENSVAGAFLLDISDYIPTDASGSGEKTGNSIISGETITNGNSTGNSSVNWFIYASALFIIGPLIFSPFSRIKIKSKKIHSRKNQKKTFKSRRKR